MLSDLKFQQNQVFILQNNDRFFVRKGETFINQDKNNTKVGKPLLLKLVNYRVLLAFTLCESSPPFALSKGIFNPQ